MDDEQKENSNKTRRLRYAEKRVEIDYYEQKENINKKARVRMRKKRAPEMDKEQLEICREKDRSRKRKKRAKMDVEQTREILREKDRDRKRKMTAEMGEEERESHKENQRKYSRRNHQKNMEKETAEVKKQYKEHTELYPDSVFEKSLESDQDVAEQVQVCHIVGKQIFDEIEKGRNAIYIYETGHDPSTKSVEVYVFCSCIGPTLCCLGNGKYPQEKI